MSTPVIDRRLETRLPALAVAALYLLPVAYAVSRHGADAVYNFFAADAYYYFTIAKNTSVGALATFDGDAPTNGFHPLWQYLLIAVSAFSGGDKQTFIWSVLVLNCAIACVAVYLLAHTLVERHRNILVPLFLVPGVFHAVSPESGLYSISAWRVLNGMESSLSLFFMAMIIRRLARIGASRRWQESDYAAIGCYAALLILARLDNVVLVATLPLYFYRNSPSAKAVAYLLVPPVAAFALYVGTNVTAGLPALPVSGSAKTGLHLSDNVRIIIETTLSALGLPSVTHPVGWAVRSRMIGILLIGCALSLGLASASFVRARYSAARGHLRHEAFVLVPFVLFLLARLSYYVVCVKLSHQGFWYYVDIAAALTAILLLQLRVPQRMTPAVGVAALSLWLAVYAYSTRQFLSFTAKHRWCPHVLDQQGARITACLRARLRNPKVLDSSDGVFSYFLDLPAEAATGLTADAAGYRSITTRGKASYYQALIADGYVVNTWSAQCDSGRISGKLLEAPIDCRQHRSLKLSKMALPQQIRSSPRLR